MRLEVQLGVNTSLSSAQCEAVAALLRAVKQEDWTAVEAAVHELTLATRIERPGRRVGGARIGSEPGR
ncbi:MAG: hypothetical protein HY329_12315 [Chloroflexi bacterium]|nr:hypothetical protein [Chloroflexota bacterium]